MTKLVIYGDELYHHGILGQKWGVRRFQNEDGSLTAEGRQRYRTDRLGGHVARAMFNTSWGQRNVGVRLNKGYKQDKKEIKETYKAKEKEFKKIEDSKERKSQLKTLKSDYKKTLGEARTNAANAIYPWQSTETNKKVQNGNLLKDVGKSFITVNGYGGLNYDRLTANGDTKGEAWVKSLVAGAVDTFTNGLLDVGEYTVEAVKQNKLNKNSNQ